MHLVSLHELKLSTVSYSINDVCLNIVIRQHTLKVQIKIPKKKIELAYIECVSLANLQMYIYKISSFFILRLPSNIN